MTTLRRTASGRINVRCERIEVYVLELQLALAKKRAQTPHDAVRAQIIVPDVGEYFEYRSRIRIRLAQQELRRLNRCSGLHSGVESLHERRTP